MMGFHRHLEEAITWWAKDDPQWWDLRTPPMLADLPEYLADQLQESGRETFNLLDRVERDEKIDDELDIAWRDKVDPVYLSGAVRFRKSELLSLVDRQFGRKS